MNEDQQQRVATLARDMAAAYDLTEEEAQRRISLALRDLEKAPEHVAGILASLRAAIEDRDF